MLSVGSAVPGPGPPSLEAAEQSPKTLLTAAERTVSSPEGAPAFHVAPDRYPEAPRAGESRPLHLIEGNKSNGLPSGERERVRIVENVRREVWAEENASGAPRGSKEYQESSEWRSRYAAVLRGYKREEIDEELRELDYWEEQELEIARMRQREAEYRLGREGHASEAYRARLANLRVEHDRRLERIQEPYEKRRREITYLRRKADEFELCGGGYERPHECPCPCGVTVFQPIACDVGGCRKCGPRKVEERIKRYGRRLEGFFEVHRKGYACYSFTLTTKNLRSGTDRLPTDEDVDRALDAVTRFSSRHFKEGLRAAIFAMEIAPDFGMIHFHGFVVAEARLPYQTWPLNKDELESDWARICANYGVEGGGGFSKIKQVEPTEELEALAHILKYVSKPYSLDPERAARMRIAISPNTRIVRTFGWFHGNTRPTVRQAKIAKNPVGVEDADALDRAIFECEKRPEIAVIREAELRLEAKEPPKPDPNTCPECYGRLLGLDTSRFYTHQERILAGLTTIAEHQRAKEEESRAPPS